MPPIKLHTDDPINTNTSTNATPQQDQQTTPTRASASNATTTQNRPGYPAVQAQPIAQPYPIQTPGPAPNALSSGRVAPPTKASAYTPAGPYDAGSSTIPGNGNGPPAPQPGAVPVPPTAMGNDFRGTGVLPPPPKAGQVQQQQHQQQPQNLPAQLALPPPDQNAVNRSSTSTYPSGPPSTLQPTSTSTQTQTQQYISPNQTYNQQPQSYVPPSATSTPPSSAHDSLFTSSSSTFTNETSLDNIGEQSAAVYAGAKKWLGGVGKKIVEVEGEVWRRVEGK